MKATRASVGQATSKIASLLKIVMFANAYLFASAGMPHLPNDGFRRVFLSIKAALSSFFTHQLNRFMPTKCYKNFNLKNAEIF